MWRIMAMTLLLTACASSGAGGDEVSQSVTVSRVIDGDSLVVATGNGSREVRIIGVNTPERGECHHSQAGERLEMILTGAAVTMAVEGTDRFGRTLTRLRADGADVALQLVRGGHGVAMAGGPGSEALIEAEEAAYRERLGMWGDCRTGAPPRVVLDPATSVTDPPGRDEDHLEAEIVFLVNQGSQPIDLTGWTLRDESSRHRFRFPDGAMIGPGGELGVASSAPGWVPGGEPVWSNHGDIAIIVDASGAVVARWRYGPPPEE